MLHAPDDAGIRLVAQGLVKLVGTDAAAQELSRLYGSQRASEALCRSATTGSTMDLQDDIEVILDLADPPVTVDLRDHDDRPPSDPLAAHPPPSFDHAEGFSVQLRQQRALSSAGRPYWL